MEDQDTVTITLTRDEARLIYGYMDMAEVQLDSIREIVGLNPDSGSYHMVQLSLAIKSVNSQIWGAFDR